VELSTAKVAELPIPCPPTDEQERIVAKVDQLMALCDKLEAQQQERVKRFLLVSGVLQDRLVNSASISALSKLFSGVRGGSVETIGATILGLAGNGSLSLECHDNDPVQIGALVGKANLRNGLSPKRSQASEKYSCLPLSSMRNGEIKFSELKPVGISDEVAGPYLVQKGDIFIMRGNGSKHLVGTAGLARSTPQRVIFPDLFIKITLPSKKINSDYFVIAWNSPVVRRQIEALAKTTSGIWKINQQHICSVNINLPTLREQERLVAVVNQLLALAKKMSDQQKQLMGVAEAFAQAAVVSITGTTSQEYQPMKAPKTELVTRLQVAARDSRPGSGEPLAALLAEQDNGLSAKALWQRSGLAIDAFYQQIKSEMAAGWIVEPEPARIREVEKD
jgi:type I restriction enzyme S subunit